jgi:hypothetical protein
MKKSNKGGKRPNSGRKKLGLDCVLYVHISTEAMARLDALQVRSKSEVINRLILQYL